MSIEAKMVFLAVAVALFVAAAFVEWGRVNLLALGAASATFPFAYDAWKLATE